MTQSSVMDYHNSRMSEMKTFALKGKKQQMAFDDDAKVKMGKM
jgi:hypothetical protein